MGIKQRARNSTVKPLGDPLRHDFIVGRSDRLGGNNIPRRPQDGDNALRS